MSSPELASLALAVANHATGSYFHMPEESRVITPVGADALGTDDEYRTWADQVSGSLFVAPGLVDLEYERSVLSLLHRLRHMAEVEDRQFFAMDSQANTRQRIAYPGESWEISIWTEDEPDQSLVPTVLVTREGRTRKLFLHPAGFEIGHEKRRRPRRFGLPLETSRVFDLIDWTCAHGDGQAFDLYTSLIGLADGDDEDWFAAHPDEPLRERFAMPGECTLVPARWEYVEVRRLGGVLWRTLLRDGELPPKRNRRIPHLIADRYAPSRLYGPAIACNMRGGERR